MGLLPEGVVLNPRLEPHSAAGGGREPLRHEACPRADLVQLEAAVRPIEALLRVGRGQVVVVFELPVVPGRERKATHQERGECGASL